MVTALKRTYIGQEATSGTIVAADLILLGQTRMTPNLTLYMPEDNERNSFAAIYEREIAGQQTDLTFEGAVIYEQIVHFLAMGLSAPTIAELTTTQVYEWTFTPSLTALNRPDQGTIRTYTWEHGDNQQPFRCGYVFANELELTYALGEPVMFRAGLTGRLLAEFTPFSTVTTYGSGEAAALTAADLQRAMSNSTEIFIDTTWAGLGTTKKAGLLVGGTVTLPTGYAPSFFHDGSLNFTRIGEDKRSGSVELTVVHNADGNIQLDNYLAGTQTFIRLLTTGALVGIAGGNTRKLRLDMAVHWTEPPELLAENHNGESAFRLRGRIVPDASGNHFRAYVNCLTNAL